MRTEKERNLLLKALDAFKRKIVVISSDFHILASAGVDALIMGMRFGKCCHEAFYSRPEPCDNCPAKKVMLTGKPSLRARTFRQVVEQTKTVLLVCLSHHG